MLLHEYQSKFLLRKFDIPVPPGQVARNAGEAYAAHVSLISGSPGGAGRAVVKAQILAGGRGKAGGVKISASAQETQQIAADLLAKTLITAQTGPPGEKVNAILVEGACDIAREFYFAVTVDRSRACPVLLFSAQGGVDIESVPPEKIFSIPIEATAGFSPYLLRKIAPVLGLSNELVGELASISGKLFDLFCSQDLSLLEINPLVLTQKGNFLPLDAKIIVDDNALFRHADIASWKDPSAEDPMERQASASGLNYIRLDGSIGCMVNGAGLAMATMDIIQLHGGRPANFLDVGGGANTQQVTEALEILLSDPHVRAVLVNIFGGIMQCDVIAQGILGALSQVAIKIPLVVRLEGTRVQIGRDILRKSGLAILEATTMNDAAQKAVAAAKR